MPTLCIGWFELFVVVFLFVPLFSRNIFHKIQRFSCFTKAAWIRLWTKDPEVRLRWGSWALHRSHPRNRTHLPVTLPSVCTTQKHSSEKFKWLRSVDHWSYLSVVEAAQFSKHQWSYNDFLNFSIICEYTACLSPNKRETKLVSPSALEKEMTAHSTVLAWRILGMAEPGGLPSMGSHSRTRLKRLSSSSSSVSQELGSLLHAWETRHRLILSVTL